MTEETNPDEGADYATPLGLVEELTATYIQLKAAIAVVEDDDLLFDVKRGNHECVALDAQRVASVAVIAEVQAAFERAWHLVFRSRHGKRFEPAMRSLSSRLVKIGWIANEPLPDPFKEGFSKARMHRMALYDHLVSARDVAEQLLKMALATGPATFTEE